MTSVSHPQRQFQPRTLSEIQVSRYDRAAALMISLLILIGFAVALMVVIWLTHTLVFRQQGVPVKLVENVGGRGDHAEGFERDMEAPGLEEMPELAEPQLEAALEAVTDTVTSVAASMDVLNTESLVTDQGQGGRGDSRPPGPLGEGDNIIPRWDRWEINWTSSTLDAYARQLDFFTIELGAAGGAPHVDYAFNVAQTSPQTRSGGSKEEKRLYMTWKGGTLEAFDRQLLGRAGIATEGRLIMQFLPEEVEDRLALIEMENAKSKGHANVKEFLRTVFSVKQAGGRMEFIVEEQLFRPAPP